MAGRDKTATQKPFSTEQNTLKEGTVVGLDKARKMVFVKLDGARTFITCQYAAGIMSSLFGLQTKFLPPKDTRVLVLISSSNYIISCLPTLKSDVYSGATDTITGKGHKKGEAATSTTDADQSFCFDTQDLPQDLLEGELDLTNAFGVGMRLLTAFASLNGGDRSRVEVGLLDDIVRVVSETFKHYSSFGNYEIYNDGRLNVRFDGTSYPTEAYGINSLGPVAELNGYEADLTQMVAETGRWRFSQYVGFLGDFIHMVVTDPQESIGKLYDGTAEALRAGKARVHINSDGTILAQSVSDIVLERVCRIPIPAEKRDPKDPEGNVTEDFENLDTQFHKIWDYGKTSDDMMKVSFQLREYARWLSNYHAYARFHQLDKDWHVPSEAESPEPLSSCGERDKKEAVLQPSDEMLNVYATIRIMRDGSIVLLNGQGCSVLLAGKDVQVAATRDLRLEAGRDVTVIAGNDLHMKARRHVVITAVIGQFVTKARAGWLALCELGTIWLKSDKKAGDPAPEHGPETELESAILLDGSGGAVSCMSRDKINLHASEDIAISTENKLSLQAKKDINIATRLSVSIRAITKVNILTTQILSSAGVFLMRGFSIKNGVLAALSVVGHTVQGIRHVRGPERKAGSPAHGGHIEPLQSSLLVSIDTPEISDPVLPDISMLDAARQWSYPEKGKTESGRSFHESYAQQYLRLFSTGEEADAILPKSEERLLSSLNTSSVSVPWPGTLSQVWQHTAPASEDLNTPSSKDPSTIEVSTANYKAASYDGFRLFKAY